MQKRQRSALFLALLLGSSSLVSCHNLQLSNKSQTKAQADTSEPKQEPQQRSIPCLFKDPSNLRKNLSEAALCSTVGGLSANALSTNTPITEQNLDRHQQTAPMAIIQDLHQSARHRVAAQVNRVEAAFSAFRKTHLELEIQELRAKSSDFDLLYTLLQQSNLDNDSKSKLIKAAEDISRAAEPLVQEGKKLEPHLKNLQELGTLMKYAF